MPFYLFKKLGEYNDDELKEILSSVKTTHRTQQQRLIDRINHERYFSEVGTIDAKVVKRGITFSDINDFEVFTEENGDGKPILKALFLNLIRSDNRDKIKPFIENYTEAILEAITYLENSELKELGAYIADLMLEIYDTKYLEVASTFRNTICFIDKMLYKY